MSDQKSDSGSDNEIDEHVTSSARVIVDMRFSRGCRAIVESYGYRTVDDIIKLKEHAHKLNLATQEAKRKLSVPSTIPSSSNSNIAPPRNQVTDPPIIQSEVKNPPAVGTSGSGAPSTRSGDRNRLNNQ